LIGDALDARQRLGALPGPVGHAGGPIQHPSQRLGRFASVLARNQPGKRGHVGGDAAGQRLKVRQAFTDRQEIVLRRTVQRFQLRDDPVELRR
jgi:hypothetical protein